MINAVNDCTNVSSTVDSWACLDVEFSLSGLDADKKAFEVELSDIEAGFVTKESQTGDWLLSATGFSEYSMPAVYELGIKAQLVGTNNQIDLG